MSSSRLPGKVLMPLFGEPMIFRQIERLRRCKNIDGIIVATSNEPSDDPLATACLNRSVDVFRGSLTDVLSRYFLIASTRSPNHIVRLTADCPMVDPSLVDKIIDLCITGNFDYYSNVMPATFPNGMDVEVMSYSTLVTLNGSARSDFDREHVTSFLRLNPVDFRWGNLTNDCDLSNLRLTVDTSADYIFISRIFESLYIENNEFSLGDVISYLRRHADFLGGGVT